MIPQSFFDDLYEKNPEGWGFSERRSQLFRYGVYFDMISRIQPSPRIALDLGCGEGYLASRLKERTACDVVGMDLSKVAIERARQKYPGIDFYECSITGVGWDLLGPHRSPDLVVLGEVLYYLNEDERRACVAGIHEALKDGAYVLVSVNIGPQPYFTRTGLHDLFRAFRCIESRGIYLKSYHKHIETLLWNIRCQVKRGGTAERALTTCLKVLSDLRHKCTFKTSVRITRVDPCCALQKGDVVSTALREVNCARPSERDVHSMVDRRLVAVTIDYETWQPIPDGKVIDWEADVFRPADRLMLTFERHGAPITFFAEIGEYIWLEQNRPEIAEKMARQLEDAIHRGHDVQLHIHPNWLPELGTRYENGRWHWDWSFRKLHDYPGDLAALIGRCKGVLESITRRAKADHAITCFRAGGYSAQPFRRIHDALCEQGIFCDSSVYSGGADRERGYDYTFAYSEHQPYFANRLDPQLKAPPAERSIIELPIFAYNRGRRWCLDGTNSRQLADQLLEYERRSVDAPWPDRAKQLGNLLYGWARMGAKHANLLIPRSLPYHLTDYGPEALAEAQYYVMIGHTKAALDFAALERALVRLKAAGCELATLSAMAETARLDLSRVCHTPEEESQRQVQREYDTQLGNSRNLAQSDYLQQMIPFDRKRVLDLGCGTGHWSSRIADLYKWIRVVGVDCGAPFIAAAQERYTSDRLSFQVEDMAALSLPTGSVDCVYADNSLEHCFDVDRTLAEVYRVLSEGGVLVAAVPSDARDSRRICDNHTWKTAPHEVKERLEVAGFVNVRVAEIDTYRCLGMPPYPPSHDRMMYVTAWKRIKPASVVEHALEMMDWVYHAIEPSGDPMSSLDPCELVLHGRGSCLTYTIVLGRFLQRQGYRVTWVTMVAEEHPRGHGARQRESHEVLAVEMDGREVILDPMANTYHPHSLRDLLCKPALAVGKAMPDERYVARNFHLYGTAEWYGRVTKYQRRRDIAKSSYLAWWHRNPFKSRLRTVYRETLPSLHSDRTDSRRS